MDNLFPWLVGGGTLIVALVPVICTTLLPLAILGGLGVYLYRRSQKVGAVRQVAKSWPTTSGVVLTSSTRVRRVSRSRPVIPVVVHQYQVGGEIYQSHVIRAGDPYGRIRMSGDAEVTVARYPVGTRVTVYDDPANLADAVLEY